MTTKHTQGPWRVKDDKQTVAVFSDDSEYSICCMSIVAKPERAPAVARANARLISAAPDLLEALARVGKHFEEAVILSGGNPDTHPVCFEVRAAIAKATGGAA